MGKLSSKVLMWLRSASHSAWVERQRLCVALNWKLPPRFLSRSQSSQELGQLLLQPELEGVDEEYQEALQGGDHVNQQDGDVILRVVQVAGDKVKGPGQTHSNEEPDDNNSCKIAEILEIFNKSDLLALLEADTIFVKKITQPLFWAQKFTPKKRKLR